MTPRTLPILVAALAVALLAAAPSALAAFPGKNGLIAFDKSKGGLYKDIYVMKPNGKGQTNITNTRKVSETDPSFSPNGRKIVFVWTAADYKHAGLAVINADGTGMKRIVKASYDEAVGSPSWTKDGKSIVFTRFQGTNPPTHVYTVGANGGSQRQLTFGDDVQDFQPLASPASGQVFFYSYPPGSRAFMYMVGSSTPLAEHEASDFTPDGKRFIFERDHDIYASAVDGSGLVKLAALPAVDEAPVWSPDGRKFIFTNEASHDVWIANADGSGLRNLTRAPGFEHDVSWGVASKVRPKHLRH
jgi:Tol biopolymer transport system component